jgi:lysophospholipase L1-like esterase
VPYPTQTQAAAAEAFIAAHPGQIGLITVSIGGNDVTACASQADPVACVESAAGTIDTNVTTLAQGLRSAAGSSVPILGLTYPDVILGEWVADPPNQNLAEESVAAFQLIVNPTLQDAYASAGGSFVDVTQHTGAYIPLSHTTVSPTYGRIPIAVAKVCRLTYFCSEGDIHARTKGYRLIGSLTVAEDRGRLH